MTSHSLISLFKIDPLAAIVMALVGFIGLIVGLFAHRYMSGDSRYRRFFCLLTLLTASVMVMAAADHLILFLFAWGISNFLLVRLMTHNPQWQAAANSGWLAAKAFMLGFACLTAAFAALYLSTGQTSISTILTTIDYSQSTTIIASFLIIVTAMTQSSIWPLHRWLISSLNAPTPVSAIMHAGLVNGGGVLLARFAPLYFSQPTTLTFIFMVGVGTAITGSVWKLMQSDIKRMLACSTMAQMGFMFIQCGLGLFAGAVAHLCWHGLFKANLFLHANSVNNDKNISHSNAPSLTTFTLAIIAGIYGSYIFSLASHRAWIANDTTLFLMVIVLITSSQFALTILQHPTSKKIFYSILLTTFVCSAYGYSILMIEKMLASMHLMQPQPLNIFHGAGLAALCLMWLVMTFKNQFLQHDKLSKLKSILYVKALNASQPHPSTITSYRHQYRYK